VFKGKKKTFIFAIHIFQHIIAHFLVLLKTVLLKLSGNYKSIQKPCVSAAIKVYYFNRIQMSQLSKKSVVETFRIIIGY